MRRIVLLLTATALMVAVMALTAVPAFAVAGLVTVDTDPITVGGTSTSVDGLVTVKTDSSTIGGVHIDP